MSISIRPAETGDLPRITAIYAHAVTNGTASYELEPPSGEEMAARFEALRKGGFPYIIAENSEGIVGYANAASVKLHEKAGFRHVGTLQGSGYKHGRWLDTVFMQLTVNGGTTLPPDPESLPERAFRASA